MIQDLDPSANQLPSSSTTSRLPMKPLSQDFGALRRETANKLENEDLQSQTQSKPNKPRVVHHLDEDTTNRVIRGSKKMSEYLHHLANEPSIGLYHVCDHVSRTVPKSVETKKSLKATNKTVEDLNYDMDYTIRTVRNLHDLDTFKNIRQLITDSIATIEMIKQKVPAKPKPSPTHVEELINVTQPQPMVEAGEGTSPPATDDSFGSDMFPSSESSQGGGFLSGIGGGRKKKVKSKKTNQTEFKPKAFQ